ncbi:esterase, partial [Tsukamurella tyrosinosolvens]
MIARHRTSRTAGRVAALSALIAAAGLVVAGPAGAVPGCPCNPLVPVPTPGAPAKPVAAKPAPAKPAAARPVGAQGGNGAVT